MKRILSIDVFRGLAVMLMIIVNHAGLSTTYSWFEHAKWHGCTLADLVFPFFLFIVGMSAVFAITNARQKGITDARLVQNIFRRSIWIFLVGLFLNMYPNHWSFEHLRILGVLQRIAICYLIASLLCMYTRVRLQMVIMGAILLFYGYLLMFGPFVVGGGHLSLEGNVVGYVDRMLLGSQHLLQANFDPEGLLSTLPAVVTTMFGGLLGHWLLCNNESNNNALTIGIFGILLMIPGLLWATVLPMNKSLWTSSFVLWTAGLAYVCYAFCYWLLDVKKWHAWGYPFKIFGTNALFVYTFHVMLIKTQMILFVQGASGEPVNLKTFLIQQLSNFLTLKNASLVYAGLSVLLCYGVVIVWPRNVKQRLFYVFRRFLSANNKKVFKG